MRYNNTPEDQITHFSDVCDIIRFTNLELKISNMFDGIQIKEKLSNKVNKVCLVLSNISVYIKNLFVVPSVPPSLWGLIFMPCDYVMWSCT